MSISLPRSGLFIVAPLVLAALGSSQQPVPLYFQHHGFTTWPDSLGSPGAMKRSVAADFTGDGTTDVFLLVGDHPVLFSSPQDWDTLYRIDNATSCSDIDRIPTTGTGACDLATIGTGGLLRLTYQSPGFVESTLSTNALFTGSTLVRAGYLNSGTQVDYVTWNPGQNKIVVWMDGGTPTSFSLAANSTVYDLALVKYDSSGASGTSQIAVLDTYGVEIFTSSGARVKRFSRTGAFFDDCFCVYHKGCDAREFIAWIRGAQATPTSQELVELHWESDTQASQLTTTSVTFAQSDLAVKVVASEPLQPASCTYGDSELVVSHLSNYAHIRFTSLHQSSPSASFDSSHHSSIDDPNLNVSASSVAGSSTMPACVFGDMNGDGMADVFVPINNPNGSSWFQFWRGTKALPSYENGPPTLDGEGGFLVSSSLPTHVGSTTLNTLTLNITLPDHISPANAVEVVVWSSRQPNSTDWPTSLDYRSESRLFFQSSTTASVVEDTGYPTQGALQSNGEYLFSLPIPIQLTDEQTTDQPSVDYACFSRIYWFEVRQSYWDGTNLRAVSRTRVVLVGSRSCPLTGWEELGFSSETCMAAGSGCVVCGTYNNQCTCCYGDCSPGQYSMHSVPGPGTMTRHRLAPTGNGQPPVPTSGPTFTHLN